MSAPTPIKPIDFLPDRYRQATKRRRTKYWRVVVVVLFLGVFAACAGGLAMVDREVREELKLVNVRHAASTAHDLALKQKEGRLGELREYADLLTFLRHPWPRSRIIDDLLRSIPASMTIDKLHLAYEARQAAASAAASAGATDATPVTAKTAATDLAELRTAIEAQDFVVHLEGTTGDQPGLHAYLQSLVVGGLFTDAEVEQIEAVRTPGVTGSKFTVRIVVRPGWGLSGGPKLEELAPPTTGVEPTVAVVEPAAMSTEVRP